MLNQVADSTYSLNQNEQVSFGSFTLCADGSLLRGLTPVHLPPKELAALRFLIVHAGVIVTPLQVREALWGTVHVTDDSIPKCISSLRARLAPEDCIQTIYKKGYRFSADQIRRPAPVTGNLPRLAILPFATEFGVPDYMGTHIAEETMLRMGRVQPALASILAQDSVFTLARRAISALEIGRMLNADLALAGVLRALPGYYRLRVELIRVADGVQLWIEDFMVSRTDAAGLEIELARQIIFHLGSLLNPEQRKDLSTDLAILGPEGNTPLHREAWEIYQRAHHDWQTLQRHRMQDGLQHLLRSTELDPSLIDARVDLANLSITQEFLGFMSPATAAEIAQRAAGQIPNLESRAERILPALGWVAFHVHHELATALRLFAISAHLPHNPWITRVRAMLALSRHRFDEAINILESALELDPYAPWLHGRYIWTLHLAGRNSESMAALEKSRKLFRPNEGMDIYSVHVLAHNGQNEKAVELAREMVLRLPYFDPAASVHAYALAAAGQKDEALQILERLQWLSRERYVMPTFSAIAYATLGDLEQAMNCLRQSEEARCPWFFQILADARLQVLASNPEFIRMRSMLDQMEASAEYI